MKERTVRFIFKKLQKCYCHMNLISRYRFLFYYTYKMSYIDLTDFFIIIIEAA